MGVSSETDLVHTFFETSFPKSYERPPLKIAKDDLTILELRALLIPHYAMWRFEISAETVRAKPLFWKTLLCKSLSMTNNLVDYLFNELGWDIQKVIIILGKNRGAIHSKSILREHNYSAN